jgi:RNA polymerase sigma factor (sigma-70 family)
MKTKPQTAGQTRTGDTPRPQGVLEEFFLQAYPFARRAAQVRSASAVRKFKELEREDLEQEALLSTWRLLSRFDHTRASLPTFVERVVATSIASVCRGRAAKKRIKHDDSDPPPEPLQLFVRIEFRIDFLRVVARLAPRDRKVALLLVEFSPTQIARSLKTSRQAVYRCINRIRAAFLEGGFCQ